eukprot:Hpha_TRINITY_DN30905_c0_g1::TRINITY_DN30905_c0_g1_i1::g.112247::m.112247
MSFGGGAWSDDETPSRGAVRRKREDDGDEAMDGGLGAPKRRIVRAAGAKRLRAANNVDGTSRAVGQPSSEPAQAQTPAPAAGLGRFHTMGHPEFRLTAMRPPTGGQEGFKEQATAWISGQCRCLQCEVTRVATLLSKKQQPRVCVLWDLDNYGFPAQLRGPAPPSLSELKVAEKAVVWAFYGLGIEAHGKEPSKLVAPRSAFGSLKRAGALQLSPCGNWPQAADEVMQRVVRIMRNVHLVVVSGDKPHLKACAKAHAQRKLLPGQPPFNLGRVNSTGKDAAVIWQEIGAFCRVLEEG